MESDAATHFDAIIIGTGLVESIVAAALSKARYSVLQLDTNDYYGGEWASLSLQQLISWCQGNDAIMHCSSEVMKDLLEVGHRFSLSLSPCILPAAGRGIDMIVKSRVASYLQFGLLQGIAIWTEKAVEKGEFQNIPTCKADIFNDSNLSLVEKRRLSKFLLALNSQEQEDPAVDASDTSSTLLDYLQRSYALSPSTAEGICYALALCSSRDDDALTASFRIRQLIRANGRYGSSPYLIGHYGGAGDIVGAYSRMSAVWGGGQILGRPLHELKIDPTIGASVNSNLFSPSPFSPSPRKVQICDEPALGIAVCVDPAPAPMTMFTSNWILCTPAAVPVVFPGKSCEKNTLMATLVRAIIIVSNPVPFPSSGQVPTSDGSNGSDSNLFVFPPKALHKMVDTMTVLQLGHTTAASPEGYYVLYMSAPLIQPMQQPQTEQLLQPYVRAILQGSQETVPLFSCFYYVVTSPLASMDVPRNFIITASLPSSNAAAAISTAIDEAAVEAECVFWKIVGESSKRDGVSFFPAGLEDAEANE